MRTFNTILTRMLLPAMLVLLLLGAPASIAAASETNLAPTVGGDEKWDAQFTPTGLNGDVYAFAVKGTDVYVGGSFTEAGGVAFNHIARWSTTTNSWYALGGGLDNEVDAMVFKGNDLYVGGVFANGLAKWNTIAHTWTPIGDGTNGPVTALAFKGNDLYVGGQFTTAGAGSGAVAANNIAKWSTTAKTWTALGSGTVGTNDIVRALAFKGSDLYVGGFFTKAGGGDANYIAKWSTTAKTWTALKSGMDHGVRALAFKGNDLYVGGQFTTADGNASNALAKWSTTAKAWTALGASSANNPINALLLKGSDLYVGGVFTTAAGVAVNHMAEYDTVKKLWAGCGNGLNDTVFELATKGSDIYAGGDFTQVGGMPASHVARFSTASKQWFALGGGVNGTVYALLVKGNDVYVGGAFNTAFNPGGALVSANNIAVWSTTKNKWSALTKGASATNGVQGDVYALAVMGNNLFVGGAFAKIGTHDAKSIARWDIKNMLWDNLQGGVNDEVYALAIMGQYVFAGGAFTKAGNKDPADHVAAFDTKANNWSVLGNDSGNGVDGIVWTIALMGNYICLGGTFDNSQTPGGDHAHKNIVCTNLKLPHDDLNLGDINSTVSSIIVVGQDLYVGGHFTKANPGPNEVNANYIARWNKNTKTWYALGSGLDWDGIGMAAKGKDVYVGGMFQVAGGKPSLNIARWMGP